MSLLRWTERPSIVDGAPRYLGVRGSVALFHISWEPRLPSHWVMASGLPGLEAARWRAETPEALMGVAEVTLIEWLGKAGLEAAGGP